MISERGIQEDVISGCVNEHYYTTADVSSSSLTRITGPRRSVSLTLRDTRVYEPQLRARIGTTGVSTSVISQFNHTSDSEPLVLLFSLAGTTFMNVCFLKCDAVAATPGDDGIDRRGHERGHDIQLRQPSLR